jgi:TonB family protein
MNNTARRIAAVAVAAACLAAFSPAARADVSYYTPPSFKNRVSPIYPDSARAKHETGAVVLKVLVAASGKPQQFIVFKSSGHKDLDDAVVAAAKASTYNPAMRGSTPTVGFYDVTYRFTLSGVAQDEGESSSLDKKLAANPKDVSTRLMVSQQYLSAKNFSAAEQTLQQGTQLTPSAKMWARLGLAYYQDAQDRSTKQTANLDQYKSASDAFDQALKLDSRADGLVNIAADSYFNYGFQLQNSGQSSTAQQYAQKAVALEPKRPDYFLLLGEAQTSLGDFANAVATLKKAESLDDKKSAIVTARILADEGNAELSQGDRANGMADINRSEQVDASALFAYEYLYSYYARSGNFAAAITPLMQLTQLDKGNAQWQALVGDMYMQNNNTAAARDAYQKAIKIDPNSLDAQFGIVQLSAMAGDTNAVSTGMAALTAKATPVEAAAYEARVAIDYLNAASTSHANLNAEAQKYADQATKADPNNPQGWYALGVADAQVNKGDKTTANFALKKAYDIFKSQNNTQGMQQVDAAYKQLNGQDLTGYNNGRDEQTNQPGHRS